MANTQPITQRFSTIFGDTVVVNRNADIETSFQYNIATNDVSTTTANGGTATQEESQAKLSTGTNANGAITLESVKTTRYRVGYEVYSFFTAMFETGGVANTIQRIGIFNDNDGFYVGYNGLDFVVGRLVEGTPIEVTKENFNGDERIQDKANIFDLTKLNVFRISYGWLGAANIVFQILSPEGEWITMHIFEIPSTLTRPHTSNPTVPFSAKIVKTNADSTDVILKTASWCAGTNGPALSEADRFFSTTGTVTTTTEAVVLNLQNPTTFQSIINRVSMELLIGSFAADGVKSAVIRFYKNLSITAPTWTDIDSVNSVIKKDIVGTVTPNVANLEIPIVLGKEHSEVIRLENLGLILRPGETLTVTASSANSTIINLGLRWKELF